MIRINKKYGIVVSNTDYCVCKLAINQKTGEEVVSYQTYHDDLRTALNRIASFVVRDAVRGQEITLAEATDRITQALDELKKDIRKAVPEAKVVK